MAGKSKRHFEVLKGFNFGPAGIHRCERGAIVTDLPSEFIGWMLAEGTIVEVPKES